MSLQTEKFDDTADFSDWRASIGALLLLPNGTNQSYSDRPYAEKLPHYQKENLLARSLLRNGDVKKVAALALTYAYAS